MEPTSAFGFLPEEGAPEVLPDEVDGSSSSRGLFGSLPENLEVGAAGRAWTTLIIAAALRLAIVNLVVCQVSSSYVRMTHELRNRDWSLTVLGGACRAKIFDEGDEFHAVNPMDHQTKGGVRGASRS